MDSPEEIMIKCRKKIATSYGNHCEEVRNLQKKIAGPGPEGKKAKREFRLKDLSTRIIPSEAKILSRT